jgi:hypothetical protein
MKKNILLLLTIWGVVTQMQAQIDFTHTTIRTASQTEVIGIGDINNDGLDDVIAGYGFYTDTTDAATLFIYYQDEAGDLKDAMLVDYPEDIFSLRLLEVDDVDGDGLNDLLVSSRAAVHIYYQNEEGNLNSPITYANGIGLVNGFRLGDLNNDGQTDIVVTYGRNDLLHIFYQQEERNFEAVTYQSVRGGVFSEVEVGDVNNDGLDDVVFMLNRSFGETLQVLYQDRLVGIVDSAYSFQYTFDGRNDFNGIAIGDLDGDGRNDVVGGIGGNTAAIVLLFQSSDGTIFDNLIELPAHDVPTAIDIHDMNCDGQNEIVVGHRGSRNISIYEKDATNSFKTYDLFAAPIESSAYDLSIGDFNGDNRPDVATIDVFDGYLIKNQSTPADFSRIDTIAVSISTIQIDTIIFNRDAYQEIDVDSTNECHIRTIITYQTNEMEERYLVVIDSTFIRFGEICDRSYVDTITTSSNETRIINLGRDTMLMSSRMDTVIYDYQPIEFFTITDTLETLMLTNTIKQTLRDTSYLGDTLIVQIDSVEIWLEREVYEVLNYYYTVYQSVTCGEMFLDTTLTSTEVTFLEYIISSDTTLLSRTTEVYPPNITSTSDVIKGHLSIQPNPTTGRFQLLFPDEIPLKGTVRIYDISGRLIRQDQIADVTSSGLDVSHLSSGYYIIRIHTNRHFLSSMFIKVDE